MGEGHLTHRLARQSPNQAAIVTESEASPEERELGRKQKELAELETELVERELELSTLQQKLFTFDIEYSHLIGKRYATLDSIEAQINELRAVRQPDNDSLQSEARRARDTANTTAKQSQAQDALRLAAKSFDPSESLKALYRLIARKLHPDLASENNERERRTKWMAKVNEAYKKRNERALRRLLKDWNASPDSVPGKGISSDLVRAIRKIDQVKSRLDKIRAMIDDLKSGSLYELYAKCKAARTAGLNLIGKLTISLNTRIADARRELADLKENAC